MHSLGDICPELVDRQEQQLAELSRWTGKQEALEPNDLYGARRVRYHIERVRGALERTHVRIEGAAFA